MTKGTHRVTEADAVRYGQLYPGVDLEQEFRNMVGWLEANPARRSETPKGVKQRIANWMSKAAQRPPSGTTVTADDRFRGAL